MTWTFFTNHAHVLFSIAKHPGIRLRDVADSVGITESAAHRIVVDLEKAGYLTRHRLGLRNFYELHPDMPLRHELERGTDIGEILAVLLRRGTPGGHDRPDASAGAESA